MSTKTTTQNDMAVMQDPDWLYNTIMVSIEPDLTMDAISTHEQKYKNESEIDKDARLESYERAFDEFDRVIDMVIEYRSDHLQQRKQEVKQSVLHKELVEKKEEQMKAEEILDSFDEHSHE